MSCKEYNIECNCLSALLLSVYLSHEFCSHNISASVELASGDDEQGTGQRTRKMQMFNLMGDRGREMRIIICIHISADSCYNFSGRSVDHLENANKQR